MVSRGLELVSLVRVTGQHIKYSECLLPYYLLRVFYRLVLSFTHRLVVRHAYGESLLVKRDCVLLRRVFHRQYFALHSGCVKISGLLRGWKERKIKFNSLIIKPTELFYF